MSTWREICFSVRAEALSSVILDSRRAFAIRDSFSASSPERMKGECVGGQVDLMARPKPRLNEINHAIRSCIGNNPHRRFSIC